MAEGGATAGETICYTKKCLFLQQDPVGIQRTFTQDNDSCAFR